MKQNERVFENSENSFLNPNNSIQTRITTALQLSLNTKKDNLYNMLTELWESSTELWEGSVFRYYFYISTNSHTKHSTNYDRFSSEEIYNLAYQIFQNDEIYYIPVNIVHSHLTAWFTNQIDNHPLSLLKKHVISVITLLFLTKFKDIWVAIKENRNPNVYISAQPSTQKFLHKNNQPIILRTQQQTRSVHFITPRRNTNTQISTIIIRSTHFRISFFQNP